MNTKEQHELMLLRQSLNAIRKTVEEQLNAVEATIDSMLPVEIKNRSPKHRTKADLRKCWEWRYKKNGGEGKWLRQKQNDKLNG